MKIFLSYSMKDIELANKIKDKLKVWCQVYLAAEDIQPGQPLSDKIVENIKSSNFLIALMTKDGENSNWVQREIGIAKASQIPIIPLVEKGVKDMGIIEGIEYITIDKDNPSICLDNLAVYINKKKKEKNFNDLILIAFLLIGAIILSAHKE